MTTSGRSGRKKSQGKTDPLGVFGTLIDGEKPPNASDANKASSTMYGGRLDNTDANSSEEEEEDDGGEFTEEIASGVTFDSTGVGYKSNPGET